jgi:UDP-N-acetylmuramate--alanine ligase
MSPNPAAAMDEPLEFRGRDVYMIGIGGCGMAGLARMMACRGARVCGSELSASEATRLLEAEGIGVGFDQSRAWLPEACDLVVASAAVKPDHPQVLAAEQRGVPVLMYAEALGKCMLGRTGVAVAGTHGKSTTTAMLGAALVDAGLDPTVIVGATCGQLAGGCLGGGKGTAAGFRLGADAIPAGPLEGQPGILIVEACEFQKSFLNYRPRIASISSVEADHLDVYGSLDEVVRAFGDFAKLVAPAEAGGRLLIAHDGAHRREVTAGAACRVETIGFSPEADWTVSYDPSQRSATLSHMGEEGGGVRGHIASWTMRVPGVHNAMNAATAAALAVMLGAEPLVVGRSLSRFAGVDRRMQVLGNRYLAGGGAVRVYDDYGHHPTEVDATLRALRDFERPHDRGGRMLVVFQPHQHSRTRHLLSEFATAFGSADVVIVPQIYFVRDSAEEKHKVTSEDLVDRLRGAGVRAMTCHPFEAIVEALESLCRDGDVLVVMGAGPVWRVARGYMEAGAREPVEAAG